MKDTGYLATTEQRARQAHVHQRQTDGGLAPQPWDAPFAPEFGSAAAVALLDRAPTT